MPNQPDLHFDIDALFAHLIESLEHTLETEREWHFTFRCDDLDRLAGVAGALEDEFDVHLQKEVQTVEHGRTFMGPPLLAVMIQAVLGPEEVRSLSARFADLAREHSLTYEGVMSFEPLEMEEAFGWLALEDGLWRLRHFSDSGLAPGEPMPFVFALEAAGQRQAEAAGAALAGAGFENTEVLEDPDEPGIGILVRVAGRNDEALLTATFQKMERIAAAAGAELLGVQFFDDDEDAG